MYFSFSYICFYKYWILKLKKKTTLKILVSQTNYSFVGSLNEQNKETEKICIIWFWRCIANFELTYSTNANPCLCMHEWQNDKKRVFWCAQYFRRLPPPRTCQHHLSRINRHHIFANASLDAEKGWQTLYAFAPYNSSTHSHLSPSLIFLNVCCQQTLLIFM
jgi:hypothetical protein